MTRTAYAWILGAFLLSACTAPVQIRNAAPVVTHVTSVTPSDDGLHVVYWLLDHEEDPVDITAAYAVGAAACESFRQQLTEAMAEGRPLDPVDAGLNLVEDVAGQGHHFSGLVSGETYPGQVHEFVWDVSALAAGDEVCLYLVPDDREGQLGDPLLSPTFPVSEGYAAADPEDLPSEDIMDSATDI